MKSNKMDVAIMDNENMYFDVDDVLDMFVVENKLYTIVFEDGEIWYNVKMRKAIYDKFEKIKKKRGQVDNV